MIASAKATLEKLDLLPGNTALLCLPTRYIAGKMMIVRCLVGNLKLIAREPRGNPIKDLRRHIDFSALVPFQLHNILNSTEELTRLNQFKAILIGGGPLSGLIENRCLNLKPAIYHTYGMTETSTHIALRRINGPNRSVLFETLPGIYITTDSRNCLVIQGDVTGGDKLVTNDVVELYSEKQFRWLGRFDHIINSGGIKIIPEELENKISELFRGSEFEYNYFISGVDDQKLGQKVILVIESKAHQVNLDKIKSILKDRLSKHELPKEIYAIHPFIFTESGKIDRIATFNRIKLKN
jgi:O-succinylbenzoic acid--CoA ligase